MSGGFGTTSQSGSTGLFGKPITNFGAPATTTTNSFAFNSTPTTNLFGTNTQTKPFGSKLCYLSFSLFFSPSENINYTSSIMYYSLTFIYLKKIYILIV